MASGQWEANVWLIFKIAFVRESTAVLAIHFKVTGVLPVD